MSDEADYGFMVWDGSSKGTLNNILNVLERKKRVLIYFLPRNGFVTAKSISDLRPILENCPPDALRTFESKLNLGSRVFAAQQLMPLR